jgi:hypothetical protein
MGESDTTNAGTGTCRLVRLWSRGESDTTNAEAGTQAQQEAERRGATERRSVAGRVAGNAAVFTVRSRNLRLQGLQNLLHVWRATCNDAQSQNSQPHAVNEGVRGSVRVGMLTAGG